MKDFIFFWKESFEFMKPKSKLWVITHGIIRCVQFMKMMKHERNAFYKELMGMDKED